MINYSGCVITESFCTVVKPNCPRQQPLRMICGYLVSQCAVIGSTTDASLNKLDTGTLGFSDIKISAEYDVEHQSVGIS
jgi:hypothetical protein